MALNIFRKDRPVNTDPSEALLRTVMATFWFAGWFFIAPTDAGDWQRTALWALHLTFGVLLFRALRTNASPTRITRTIRVQTLIIVIGLFIQPESFSALSPIVAMLAAMRLSRFWWVLWALALSAVNIASEVGYGGYPFGFFDGLVQASIILAFATFAFSLNRAQRARAETQAVLADLRQAHERLQEYADQIQDLVIAEERGRISRDLHDTLGHRLTVSIVQLEGAGRLVPDQPQRASQMIETVREQLVEGLQDVRSTVSKLRTPAEREPSLVASIAHLADDFEQATQLAVTVSVEEDLPPLPEQRRQALFLATQEALTNIQRHAQARVATITLRNAAEYSKVIINVDDDGQGMTAGSIENGFGLRGMKERIEHLGGSVDIDSAVTKGTSVHVTLPIGDYRDSA